MIYIGLNKKKKEKSGSYKFYKNNYERLLKENQELSNLIEQYKKFIPQKNAQYVDIKESDLNLM